MISKIMLSLTFLVFLYSIDSEPIPLSKFDTTDLWENYKEKFGIKIHPDEEKYKQSVFYKNLDFINNHNSKNTQTILEVNRFTHLEKHEINFCLNVKNLKRGPVTLIPETTQKIPLAFDWREMGVVTPVKNQEACGSCYAFSAIAAIESQIGIHLKKSVNLSEQQIVDCSGDFGNGGCDGGFPIYVYEYAETNSILPDEFYPYIGQEGKCKIKHKNNLPGYKVSSYHEFLSGDENQLIYALLRYGPISVAIDASDEEFIYYKSGIINIPGCDEENLNHAVTLVGYNITSKPYYAIVKNSWGLQWGLDGYFKISLFNYNMCGIASYASVPVLETLNST